MSDTEFELFVMNAGPDILRFCRIITNNKEQGDELYQDAMVLLLEKRVSLKAEQNSKSYALSVAVLLWKNKKKKYANRNRLIPIESMDAMEHDKISELKEESAPSPETCILQADEKKMIQKIDETEINAVVIDVKDDNGRITFQMDQPLAEETGAVEAFIPDIQGLMDTLKEHNIYTIARVVSFRDPYLAEKKPELALKLADGSLYRDKKGMAWVNPYKQEMWDYLVQ